MTSNKPFQSILWIDFEFDGVNFVRRTSCMWKHIRLKNQTSLNTKKANWKVRDFGASDQTWTGTDVTPQDFKSCASADFATLAKLEAYKVGFL